MKQLVSVLGIILFSQMTLARINCLVFKAPYRTEDLVEEISDIAGDPVLISLKANEVNLLSVQTEDGGENISVFWRGMRFSSPLKVGERTQLEFSIMKPAYRIHCERTPDVTIK